MFRLFLLSILISSAFCTKAAAQRIAVLIPEPSALSTSFADRLEDELAKKVRIFDRDAAGAAIRSITVDSLFNLNSQQARQISGLTEGSYLVIINSGTTRRTSSAKPSYFEAYAAIFLVSAREGSLEQFILESKEASTADEAEAALQRSVPNLSQIIVAKVTRMIPPSNTIGFDAYDPDSKNMRPPMPYKRIKPEYTPMAYLYGVAASVEAEVTVATNGDVTRIDIVRWAGYGLDEAVIAAIRQMNWRPGERNGKPLPMRVLLRYNFTKVEKAEQ